ncbi:hypothetical protein OF83DRAFT_1279355 [Amylostereum chailletii]|nr:hypothetical protein OF83DRAFT_1279355 [Amylostereum chailletii]
MSFLLSDSGPSSLEELTIESEALEVSLGPLSTSLLNIRRLVVNETSFTGTVTTPFDNLISLTLTESDSDKTIPPSIFSSIFHSTPALQTLDLKDAFPFCGVSADQHPPHTIILPTSLTKMTMTSNHHVHNCLGFHNMLKIPSSAATVILMLTITTFSSFTLGDLLYPPKSLFIFDVKLFNGGDAIFQVVDGGAMPLLASLGCHEGEGATTVEGWPSLEILSIIEASPPPGPLDDLLLHAADNLLEFARMRRARGRPIREVRLPERFLLSGLARELEHEGVAVKTIPAVPATTGSTAPRDGAVTRMLKLPVLSASGPHRQGMKNNCIVPHIL